MKKTDEDYELEDYWAKMDRISEGLAYAADQEYQDFLDWCKENNEDPEGDDVRELYKDALEYAEDPYKYNGLRRSDFY